MEPKKPVYRKLLNTLWNAVAGWVFVITLLLLLVGGFGATRFMTLKKAMRALGEPSMELKLLFNFRSGLMALENASRYSGSDEPTVFIAQLKKEQNWVKTQLSDLRAMLDDSTSLLLVDSLAYLLDERGKQLNSLAILKYEQKEAGMPETLLESVEAALRGKIDSAIVIRLDQYIQKRTVPLPDLAEEDVEAGRKGLLRQLKELFVGKKKSTTETPTTREELVLTDSLLTIDPLQADNSSEIKELLESARAYNARIALRVQRKELAIRASGQLVQQQLNQLTANLEAAFVAQQEAEAARLRASAGEAANMLALTSLCGLLFGLMFLILIKRLLRISANRQKLLEAEQKKVDALLQSRQALVASISHELRTPLQAIIGFAAHLAQSPEQHTQRDIGFIKQSADQLQFLIDQILQYNQFNAGKGKVSPDWYNVDELLTLIDEMYAQKFADKKLEWSLQLGDELQHKSIFIDVFRLRQLLFNLLDNAYKFTHTGSVKGRFYFENDTFIIQIQDTGVGMTAEQQAVVFEPYTQLSQARVNEGRGIGLGLYMVKQLVELLGGKLALTSAPAIGSTFEIRLPALIQAAMVTEAGNDTESDTIYPWRIAIIEDDVLNQELLRDYWSNKFTNWESFNSVEAFWEAADQGAFDIILTDYLLPGKSGVELIKEFANWEIKPCIFLMSASIPEEAVSMLLENKIEALIEKPFDPARLQLFFDLQLAIQRPASYLNSEILADFIIAEEERGPYLEKYKATVLKQLEALLEIQDTAEIHASLHQLGSRLAMFNLPGVSSLRQLEKNAAENNWSRMDSIKMTAFVHAYLKIFTA
jgi:signal transduction histidine kinase/DNA-binding response OmpR family regulator